MPGEMKQVLDIAHCVESYHPAVGGMQEVVKQLSERIAALGHKVTVYTSDHPARTSDVINGVQIRPFQMVGNVITGYTGDKDGYIRALAAGGHDVVTLFAAQQWSADLVLQRADEIPAKKVFVPTGFSRLHLPVLKDYWRNMARWMKKMDLNVFLSHRYQDMEFARKHGVPNLIVIPNGAAADEFTGPVRYDLRKEHGINADRKIILHLGSFTGLKGHEEALRIFEQAETGDAVLVFVGSDIDRFVSKYYGQWRSFRMRWRLHRQKKRVLYLKLDRKRTVDAMKQADLFLFPSRVECSPIVLFESMAAGVPFLSSTAGNAEEIVEWSHGGWTMPGTTDEHGWWNVDIATGASMLTELLRDPYRLKSTGAAGHAAWQERFTWERIAARYLEEYEKLVHG